VVERRIKPAELPSFTECFITGSAAELTPVREIGPHNYQPGRISEQLLNDYMAVVDPAAARKA
jgi:branched-chain amino acid aminotransferase